MENENEILVENEDDVVDVEIDNEDPVDAEDTVDTDDSEPAEQEEGGFNIDDLEYDENGDIIIPDETAEETSSETVENNDEAAEPASDPKDETIAALKRKLEDLEAQAKDTLKKLSVDTDDVMDGLASLAAETEDISKEEYIRQRDEARAKANAEAVAAQTQFEQLAANDLAELQAKYPETKAYKHIKDMPEAILGEFAKYRDLGLSAEKAYAAANPDGIRTSVAASVKREVSGKEHLQSNVPKGSNKTAVKMSRAQMEEWREMFGDRHLSDKEIVALYRKTLPN